jgi:hypothetical protein
MHFSEIIPGLRDKYKSKVEIEITSKTREDYRSNDHAKLGLPVAPAIMVGDEVIAQSCDQAEEKIDRAIRRQLGLPISS